MGDEAKHQLSMVMNLNKCIGCHTCSIACKTQWTNRNGREAMWWNTVNTMPGRGTPRDWEKSGGGFGEDGKARPGRLPSRREFGDAWEFNYEEVLFGGQGDKAHLQVVGEEPDWGPNWDEDQGGGEYPNSYYFYLPRICNHCTHPACLAACPRKAIVKREEDGIVLIDEDRCRGYRFCLEACPYKKIYFNYVTKVVQKCISCFPRIEKGLPMACARQCVGRIRLVGYRDDRDGPVFKLVEQYRVALPLHGDWGTEPNVFYVPPTAPPRFAPDGKPEEEPRIPLAFLEDLFGPGVKQALATLADERKKKARGEESELMDLLIGYRHQDMFKLS
jgi:dimethylsulfide dehydrogenase subunit beta/complex iron-sulfur molybdoenzyme family reductase subunit beta